MRPRTQRGGTGLIVCKRLLFNGKVYMKTQEIGALHTLEHPIW